MITALELRACSESLYIYDVVQEGWEQHPNGPIANIWHIFTQLVQDITGKDFRDPARAREAIAPDCVQYALRLARYTGQSPGEMVADQSVANGLTELPLSLGSRAVGQYSYIEATATIARNLHDLGHKKDRDDAIKDQPNMAKRAGGLLVHCANSQAAVYDFDLVDTFNDRLAYLRQRFGIPQP